jgi:hypothetical protein
MLKLSFRLCVQAKTPEDGGQTLTRAEDSSHTWGGYEVLDLRYWSLVKLRPYCSRIVIQGAPIAGRFRLVPVA